MLDCPPTAVNLFASRRTRINLRRHAWLLSLEQRYFGPRKLLVAFADHSGRLRGMSHCERTDPIEVALAACLRRHSRRAPVAVAYCDEAITVGVLPDDLADRFERAAAVCADFGVHLVDWFGVDDLYVRSYRTALESPGDWWVAA